MASPTAKKIAIGLAGMLSVLCGVGAAVLLSTIRPPTQPAVQQTRTEATPAPLPPQNEQALINVAPVNAAPATPAPAVAPPSNATAADPPAATAPAAVQEAHAEVPPVTPASEPAPGAAAATEPAPTAPEQKSQLASLGVERPVDVPPPSAAAVPVAAPDVVSKPSEPPAPPEPEIHTASLPSPSTPLPPPRPATGGSDTVSKDAAKLVANLIFSQVGVASAGRPHAIGEYNKGCLAGGAPLPLVGDHWQVMRPSRNRNWGHPELVDFIERLAGQVHKAAGWPGILIGDMSQPRGGPLPFGHASHQIGLDVDIWLRPMPEQPFPENAVEREETPSVLAADRKQVDHKIWTDGDAMLVRLAAEQPQVERIFVNAAIKKELCSNEKTRNASWISKVRPWWGHDDHMHVRLKCPPGSATCKDQPPVGAENGCGKPLESWFKPAILDWRPPPDGESRRKPILMKAMPAECSAVAKAPAGVNFAARQRQ